MSAPNMPTTNPAAAPSAEDPPREDISNGWVRYSQMSRAPDAEDVHRFDHLSTPSNNLSASQYDAAWYKDYYGKHGRPHVTDYVRIAAIQKEQQRKAKAERARLAKAEQKKKQSLVVKLQVQVPEEWFPVEASQEGSAEGAAELEAAAVLEAFAAAEGVESDDEDEDVER